MSSGGLEQPSSELLDGLQRECYSLQDAVELLCGSRDALSPEEVRELYGSLRSGVLSINQVNAAIKQVCGTASVERNAEKNQIGDILKELDRRYYIVESTQWEFAMLDRNREGAIAEQDALFLFMVVHDKCFQMENWTNFCEQRSKPGSKVTWSEIEVPLCDVPDFRQAPVVLEAGVTGEEEHHAKEQYEGLVIADKDGQVESVSDEQLVRRHEDHLIRERELLDSKQEEQQATSHPDHKGEDAEKEEEEKVGKADYMEEVVDDEDNAKHSLSSRHSQLKANLERAIQSQEVSGLESAIKDVKEDEVPNSVKLLKQAEQLLEKLYAAQKLRDATTARKLAALEHAINAVKKGGWQKDLQKEMEEASILLEKLQRLEQRKRAVLELSQRVVAELKSYSKPPPLVHQVMSATLLLLGNPESETKSWQATQVLIGKTGKSSLKRRVAECSAERISLPVAKRALSMLQQFDFVSVQDTSLGCAAFHSWAEGMIEEAQDLNSSHLENKI